MPLRRLVPLALALVVGAVGAGCGDDDPPPVPLACTSGADAITRALATAPAAVALDEGGTTIRDCLTNATSASELQEVGATLTNAGEDLEDDALDGDAAAALRLGYLAGAARAGAGSSEDGGVREELAYRLEQSAGAAANDGDAAVAEAVAEGQRAGASRG